MLRFWFVFTFSICAALLQGQVSFQHHIIDAVGNSLLGPRHLEVADLNGDMHLDILIASQFNNQLLWMENTDGQGSYGALQLITADLVSPQFVQSADLDGDGDLDVLSASKDDDKIAWFENLDGQGTFDAGRIITENANGAIMVRAADLDGDGDQDVLSISNLDEKVAWYENEDGQGSFSDEKIISSTCEQPFQIFAQDLDEDLDLDVIVGFSQDNKIAWFENLDGTGNFDTLKYVYNDFFSAADFSVIDFDQDNDLDLFALSYDELLWLEKIEGPTNFSDEQIISTEVDGNALLQVVDMDQDNDYDILVASRWNGGIFWFENQTGINQFSAKKIIDAQIANITAIQYKDVNGDDLDDIIATAFADDLVAIYINAGDGSFAAAYEVGNNASHSGAEGVEEIQTVDLDKDGDMDIIAALESGIVWYENVDGLGTFSNQKIISSNPNGRSLYFGDMDEDNDIDVVSVHGALPNLVWHEQTANGDFNADNIIAESFTVGTFAVHCADLDADEDPDIIFAAQFRVGWFENFNGSNFFDQNILNDPEITKGESIHAADLDKDGDIDILVAATVEGVVIWYENLGNGNFADYQLINDFEPDAESVYAADIDNDGDQDVLSASSTLDYIKWYENLDGAGSFSERTITSFADGAMSVYAADLDLDGDQDVLSAASIDHEIAWYENLDGQGDFGAMQIISNQALGAQSVLAADIDLDGDLDVISAAKGNAEIVWYENLIEISTTSEAHYQLNVFPTLTTDIININSNLSIDQYSISDLNGKPITGGSYFQQIDVGHIPSGIYFLNILLEKGYRHTEVIVKM